MGTVQSVLKAKPGKNIQLCQAKDSKTTQRSTTAGGNALPVFRGREQQR
ncbi:hypothetical protein SynBIOSE41_01508 [Synechococcus sp. BIOS-E4-1]|nr:hypothetical protein SynBIOSE41_01508 [Synechococcus sp. BIOS-E4-1]